MRAVACLIILCSLALAGTEREIVITGEVSDSQCAFNVHSSGNSHDDVIKTGVLGTRRKSALAVAFAWAGSMFWWIAFIRRCITSRTRGW